VALIYEPITTLLLVTIAILIRFTTHFG